MKQVQTNLPSSVVVVLSSMRSATLQTVCKLPDEMNID